MASTTKNDLFLEVLRYEFSRRVQKNPHYSLRAFGKQLRISHTLLSFVLNGRRKASVKMVEKFAEAMQYSPNKTSRLIQSLGSEKDLTKLGKSRRVAENYERISLDQFALISEWQHFAILSLLEIADTELTPAFIAKRLNISPLLAKISIQRLKKLEIIEQMHGGGYRQKAAPIVVENIKSTIWTRKFQQQLIGKAVESLQNDPIELRDFSSITFAMDPKYVPLALERIRVFRRKLCQELEILGKPEEVYNLSVQIFPTSRSVK